MGGEKLENKGKLFSLELEGQPLSGNSDYSLKVSSHPLEVVANKDLLERMRKMSFDVTLLLRNLLGTFFTPRENIELGGFSSATLNKLSSVKAMTNLQLMDVLQHHKTIDLSMDIKVSLPKFIEY